VRVDDERFRAVRGSRSERNSGKIAAGPAYAASTCSQTLRARVISRMAATGSLEVVDVVPTVATAAIGRRP